MSGGEKPELRLGLVLYGGVSLAVYIYGVAVEVQRLLAASAEFEAAGPDADTAELGAYGKAMRTGGLSRASVDIVAGTSAGGINGILLAKALATGADVEQVRKLWIEEGDIGGLLRRIDDADPESLLSTDVMESQLAEGFDRLGGGDGPRTDGPLDLFVSTTHLRGDRRRFRDSLGASIDTLMHRYVVQLKLRPGYERDDFARPPGADESAATNAHLVKLSRATSAFPVAFEPVRIDEADGILGPRDEPSAWFADGGILNNKPFTEALETIFTRSSDRPVRRWLLSVDPDPKQVERPPPPGPKPAFDQVALSAVAEIPRYQSISGDLESLQEHNATVRRVAGLIADLEQELSGREASPLERVPTSYRRLRARAFAEEIADWLMLAEWRNQPSPFEPRAIRRAFVEGAYEALRSAGWEGEAWRELPDLAYELRRVYYLIKLLGAPAEVVERRGDGGLGPEAPVPLRRSLWGAFELIRQSLWESFSREPIAAGEEGGLDRASGVARERVPAALEHFVAICAQVARRLEAAIDAASVVLPAPGPPGQDGAERLEVWLEAVFRGFAYRDSLLLPIEAGGGLRHRDLVEHAQISPASATSTGVPAAGKLAGDTAGHFGGFLDEGWRENDLLWGRLDAAEILVGAIMDGATGEERAPAIEAVHREILEAEGMREALEAPGGWRAYLGAHAIGDTDISKLPDQKRIDGLKVRAGLVLREMLAKAAKDAREGSGTPQGKVRRRVLASVDGALTWAGRFFYPYIRVLRRRARKYEPPS